MEVISYRRAAELIEDGWTVSTSGFTGSGHPEGISSAIEKRFLDTGRPRHRQAKRHLLFPHRRRERCHHDSKHDRRDSGGMKGVK